MLHFLNGLSLAEVGTRLGRSQAAAVDLIQRGLKAMRKTLGAEPPRDRIHRKPIATLKPCQRLPQVR